MKMIWTVAKKELRGYFGSAVALVFLGAFLGITLFSFFWDGGFFARGVADVRPMFNKLPLLLILLTAALSMRLWSEEQKGGTIEILMTLPVPKWQLVVGKFLAGMVLICVALGLTLGIPLTVSMMGNLDWGPVWGGYVAALLLAAAYLAIGMCISAATDNQLVALISTVIVCLLLYLPGAGAVLSGKSMTVMTMLRSVATGTRFESIARGVLDLRDLFYYLSLTAFFLALNIFLLVRRGRSQGARTRGKRQAAMLAIGLAAANALLLNLWMAPVDRARIDLTEAGEYSLSSTTKRLLNSLEDPLVVRAYFSEKTHPKLAPLVPRIIDMLEEYRIAGGKHVRVEVVDPSKSDSAKKEAKELYDIAPIPVQFSDRNEKSVLNVYFHILVEYGDQHKVLSFDDLIEIKQQNIGEVEISLKNFEYDLTKTIKKTVEGFKNVDALLAAMPGTVEVTTLVTPSALPEEYKKLPETMNKVIEDFKKSSKGKLTAKTIEPKTEAEMKDLFEKYGVQPYQDLFSGNVYYLAVLLKVGDRVVRMTPSDKDLSETTFKTMLTDGIKRAAPGFTKVVGIVTPPQPPPQPPMMQGMPPQELPPPQSFEQLQAALRASYEVRPVTLDSGTIADDINTLILAGPKDLSDAAVTAVDQFVMRGGSLIVLDGRYRLDLVGSGRGGLVVEKVKTGLEDMLAHWGITVGEHMVLDTRNDAFPIPVDRGGFREIEKMPYPYFVSIDSETMSSGNLVTSGISGATMHFVSPVSVGDGKGVEGGKGTLAARKVDLLMKTSSGSWLDDNVNVQPEPGKGVAKPAGLGPEKQGAQSVAVAVSGGFASWAAAKAKNDKAANAAAPTGPEADNAKTPLIEASPPDARVVVFGSSAFASDDLLRIAAQFGGGGVSNVQLVQNAVDWSLSDTDLLSIRARNSAARALKVSADSHFGWELKNYAIAFGGLLLLILAIKFRRVTPIIGKEA